MERAAFEDLQLTQELGTGYDDAMDSGVNALREVERALERGDVAEAEHLLSRVERMNAAIRDAMGVDEPY